jgi:WD repeat-containing protein 61
MQSGSTRLAVFSGHRDCVYALTHASGPWHFFSAGADGWVAGWNLERPGEGKLVARLPHAVYALGYDEEEGLLLAGSNRDGIHILDPLSGSEIWNAGTPGRIWYRLVKTAPGQWTAAGDSGWLAFLDLNTRKAEIIHTGDANLRALAFDPASGWFALGDSAARVWFQRDLRSGQGLQFPPPAHNLSVFGADFYPGGRQLVTAGRDARLIRWDLQPDSGLWEAGISVPAHMFAIHDVKVSPHRKILATAGTDKTIKIWDADNLKLLRVIDKIRYAGHGHSINQLLWLQNPEVLLSCSDDRTISAWDIFS